MAELLKELTDTIQMVRDRANNHTQYFSDGPEPEWRTRVGLIDPVLRVLGWDVSDPTQVEVEYPVQLKRADYALLNEGPTPSAFVEAKRLGAELEGHREQMTTYSNMGGVKFACLTNGDVWEVYDVYKQAPMEEKRIFQISITKTPVHECALKLLYIWLPNLRPTRPIEAQPPAFGFSQESTTTVGENSSAMPPGGTPLSEVPDPTHKPAPKAIYLPDGERTLTSWRGVLVQTALWLHRKQILTQGNCMVMAGGKRVLFSVNGAHPGGDSFKGPVPLDGTGIIMEGHLSARETVRYAVKVLKHFNQDPSQVYLKL